MKSINIILMALLITFTACYEDKGNYEYSAISKVKLEKHEEDGEGYMLGDTIKMNPIITIEGENQNMKLDYKWTWEGVEIGNEPTLEYEIKKMPEKPQASYLNLDVMDVATGVTYRLQYTITIYAKYESTDFMLLSKKNGKVDINTFVVSKSNEQTYLPEEYKINLALNSLENPDTPLDPESFLLTENFAYIAPKTEREEMILSPTGIQFLDGNLLTADKETTLANMFWEKNIPSTFTKLQDALFMKHYQMLFDDEGKMYSRIRASHTFFQSEYFLPEPVMLEGETEPLKGLKTIPNVPWGEMECNFIYDSHKKRILVIWDMQKKDVFNDGGVYSVGKIETLSSKLSSNYWPRETETCPYPKIEDMLKHYEVIHVSGYKPSGWGSLCGLNLVVRNDAGEIYNYSIEMEREWSSPKISFKTNSETNEVNVNWKQITGESATLLSDTKSIIYTLPNVEDRKFNNRYCTFVANGNTLYVCNRAVKNPVLKKITDFNSPIKCMNAYNYLSKVMGIACEDGSFHVISLDGITDDIGKDWGGILWETPADINVGTPLVLIYREAPGTLGLNWQ